MLSSFIYESNENSDIRSVSCNLIDEIKGGRLIVADLTDPLLSPSEANGVFQVLLSTFRHKKLDGVGKVIAFDEAHRYMSTQPGENDALAQEIMDCARLMRHDGLRLLISTQSQRHAWGAAGADLSTRDAPLSISRLARLSSQQDPSAR